MSIPGPHVSPLGALMVALSPVRVPFDSLTYMTESAAQFGAFYGIHFGTDITYVVTDPDLAHEILVKRAHEFHKAPMLRDAVSDFLGNGLLTSEDDFWRRQRKLAQPAFHHQRIAAYAETMVAQSRALVARWQAGQTLDVAEEMMHLTLGIVTKTLFNMDVSAQSEHIGRLMLVLLAGANDRINRTVSVWERVFRWQARAEAAALRELDALMLNIITAHRQQGDTGDLLSMLLAARDDDGQPMSEKQLRDEVMTLFAAGHETTANALAWAFYLLAQNPAVEDRLRAEIATLHGQPPTLADLARLPYSEMVIKETMRLYPPAGGVTRSPKHDLDLGGYRIPQGANLAISTYAMHRRADLFPDPLKFDPERFSPANEPNIPKYAYLPFGGGPRVCIGNTFALMEARLALITILQAFRLRLAPGQKVQAEQLFTIRPKGGLKMVVTGG